MFLSLTLICWSDSIYQEFNMNQILESRGAQIYLIGIPLVCYMYSSKLWHFCFHLSYVHMMKIIKKMYKDNSLKTMRIDRQVHCFFLFFFLLLSIHAILYFWLLSIEPVTHRSTLCVHNHRRSWHGLTTPFFFNFLFTNLFSIRFLYFFVISSLFP